MALTAALSRISVLGDSNCLFAQCYSSEQRSAQTSGHTNPEAEDGICHDPKRRDLVINLAKTSNQCSQLNGLGING